MAKFKVEYYFEEQSKLTGLDYSNIVSKIKLLWSYGQRNCIFI